MSYRSTQARQAGGSKGFGSKAQKIFVPKSQDQIQKQNPNPISKDPNPATPTLSNSLRQSLSQQPSHDDDHAAAASATKNNGGRARGGGNFVNYLPQDEAVAAGLGADEGGLDPLESQRVVDLLNRELSWLLKLNPREFWREVATDTSLHEFLDSFLQFRSRWYDFPHHGAKGMVAGVIVGELELSRRAFMVLYRISSNRDPGARAADSLSAKDHGVLLQEKKLLDLPKLLDICAVYGHKNEDLTTVLVRNALSAQPRIHDSLTSVMSQFLSIVHTMHQRCSSSLEVLFSSGRRGDHESSCLYTDMLEVMDFINDAVVSMDAFISAYKPAAVFFSFPVDIRDGNGELLCTLAKLHDSFLPSLQRGFQVLLTSGEDTMKSNIGIGLNLLATRIIKFGWKLLDFCYISDEVFEDNLPIPAVTKMFPANIEDPVIRADILVQTFREISTVSACSLENQSRETFLQHIEKNFDVMSKLENIRKTGWISMDDEQLEYMSGIFVCSKKATAKELATMQSPVSVTSNKVQIDEDAAIRESKISQIRDLFPDYGKGFLAACLEAYNQNPEEVIQRILEGTLHEDLQTLDTLETMPIAKMAKTVSKNDKGKGKLVESAPVSSTNLTAAGRVQQSEGRGKLVECAPVSSNFMARGRVQQSEGSSVSSSSYLGRFVRKSKGDLPDSNTLDNKDEKDSARIAALLSQYEYEDEYDDSFDDLGLSVAESGLEENEILGDKISSNVGKSWEKETESSSQNISSSRWGSRKKPQYYVKDGKNYSYKVEGSVAVANAGEASLVTQAQKELIYGLGRGGNLPLGAVKKLMEGSEDQDTQPDVNETEVTRIGNSRGRGRRGGGRHRGSKEEQDKQFGVSEGEGRENMANSRGRGRRGGGQQRDSNEEQDNQFGVSEGEGRDNNGNSRGRGRRGGGRNHYRKDQAVAKHFSGLSGY
ncbi:Ubiquitin system component Cue [Parasponia andersonii]|uniref:Ubiquitin system component Cue n=1 Tax=Parasponia andersonii TaxID=3476 RepID=A0A2P5DHZ5_PARAD|nr:Ubiquitin system component Cue [Parasponia andersonii]